LHLVSVLLSVYLHTPPQMECASQVECACACVKVFLYACKYVCVCVHVCACVCVRMYRYVLTSTPRLRTGALVLQCVAVSAVCGSMRLLAGGPLFHVFVNVF